MLLVPILTELSHVQDKLIKVFTLLQEIVRGCELDYVTPLAK